MPRFIPWVFAAIAGLVWLFGMYQAIVASARHVRFYRLALELTPATVVAGDELTGMLVLGVPFDPERQFHIVLSATQYTRVVSGRNARTEAATLYSRDIPVRAEAHARGTVLRFSARIPEDAHQTLGYGEEPIATDARIYFKWHARVCASLAGIDVDEWFEIPVVRPGGSELALRAGENPSFVLVSERGEVRIVQPAWKKPGRLLFIANVLGVGALGTVYLTAATLAEAGWRATAHLLLLACLALIAAVVLYIGHELAVAVSPRGLRIMRRLGSRMLMDVTLPRERIAALEVGTPLGRYTETVPARSVRVLTSDGQSYAIAEYMTRARDVLALCNLLAARLALPADALRGTAELRRPPPVHSYEKPGNPRLKAAGSLIAAALLAWAAWPFVAEFVERNTDSWAALRAELHAAVFEERPAAPPPPPYEKWQPSFERALTENSARRFDAAVHEFEKILSLIEREFGPDYPAAGLIYSQLAMVYGNQSRRDAQEAALKRSLAILERHPAATAKEAMGPMGWHVDKESVARELGDLYWSRRRPADAYNYYQKAYAAAAELDTTEEIRNERLALAAAGLMVTTCMLGKWDLSDRAMAEIKQRFPTVPANSQSRLKYWIDTGEPRLKARQC